MATVQINFDQLHYASSLNDNKVFFSAFFGFFFALGSLDFATSSSTASPRTPALRLFDLAFDDELLGEEENDRLGVGVLALDVSGVLLASATSDGFDT